MKVRYINPNPADEFDPAEYWSLIIGNIYNVIEIHDDSYLIIDSVGTPVYFLKRRFEVIDPEMDEDWVEDSYEDGEQIFGPSFVNEPGFLEDYHDDMKYAIDKFDKYLVKKFERRCCKLEGLKIHAKMKESK